MLAVALSRPRVALFLNLSALILAGSGCSEPPRVGGRTVSDCVADLDEPGTARRLAALHTLAQFGGAADRAVEPTAALLGDSATAEAAIATLAAIGTPRARAALTDALQGAEMPPASIAAAATACAAVLERDEIRTVVARIARDQPGRAAFLLSFDGLWAACGDAGASRRATVATLTSSERLPRLEPREWDEVVRHTLAHPEDFADPTAVLIRALEHSPVRPEVLAALGRSGEERALDAVLARCRAPWPNPAGDWLRAAAALSQDDIDRQARVLTALGAALRDGALPIRLAAIHALGVMGAQATRISPTRREVAALLAEAARDARPTVEAAARTAWLALPGEATAVAAGILGDTDLDRAKRAIHALGESPLPDDVILPALTRIADAQDSRLAASVARAASRRVGGGLIQISTLLDIAAPDVDAEVIRAVTAWARDPRIDTASLAAAAASAADDRRAAPLLDALTARQAKAQPSDAAALAALSVVVADSGAEPARRARLLGWLCKHAPTRAALPFDVGSTRAQARVFVAGAAARLDLGGTREDLPVLVLRRGRATVQVAHLGDRRVFRIEEGGGATMIEVADPAALTLSETDPVTLVLAGNADGMGPSIRLEELAVIRILLR